MNDYNKRLVEVDEVLNYLSDEDLLKIPEDIRQAIKENKDKEYVWKYDVTKELKDQKLNRDTIIILSYLNMEYLLNEEQKKLMQQIHELNEKKLEEAKAEKYGVEDLFKRNKPQQEEQKETEQEMSLVEYKESFFTKLISKIKKIFCKN
ncbi:MAG: hypothetical protein E7314_07990 [Clostridiales bacterium]|nr:hypothetical protein [Clostridiales bacterium]